MVPYIRGLQLVPYIRGLLLIPDIGGGYCWYLISGGFLLVPDIGGDYCWYLISEIYYCTSHHGDYHWYLILDIMGLPLILDKRITIGILYQGITVGTWYQGDYSWYLISKGLLSLLAISGVTICV